jgi:hypothetical protein
MELLSNAERLNLQKMVNESECEDNTENIRRLKHSILLRDEIRKLDIFKQSYAGLRKSNQTQYDELARAECTFLYNNYTDIFNRLMKDELNLEIMTKLLIILKHIEDGKVNQHEGSVMVGKVLKELYVDSALKQAEHLDLKNPPASVAKEATHQVSWKEYKLLSSK